MTDPTPARDGLVQNGVRPDDVARGGGATPDDIAHGGAASAPAPESLASGLQSRPAISTPPNLQPARLSAALRTQAERQPGLGLAGLTLVIPIAALFALGLGGPERSVLILGPIITFALPAIAMVGFWWNDWPGTRASPNWSGWLDTALIIVIGIALTAAGQALVAHADLRGLFQPGVDPIHSPTFPQTLPLSAAAFVVMLQITVVGEQWPLRKLPPIAGGLAALALSWCVAWIVMVGFVGLSPGPQTHRVVTGAEFGAALTSIGVWQVWLYVMWRGWPIASISRRSARLTVAHLTTAIGGVAMYAIVQIWLDPETITAVAGAVIAAALVTAMLFDGAIAPDATSTIRRTAIALVTVLVAAGLYAGLTAFADSRRWTTATAEAWVAHACLNALGASIILHVAIGRRWPFAQR